MSDADGADWPPESNMAHPDHLNWVSTHGRQAAKNPPPEPPTIVGRNGTVYEFGSDTGNIKLPPGDYTMTFESSLNSDALRLFYGGTVSSIDGYTLGPEDITTGPDGIPRYTATGLSALTYDVHGKKRRTSMTGRIDSHSPNLQPVVKFPTIADWAKMKDGLMADNEEVLRRRIERARADIDEYAEKLAWLESLPIEPETPEDGDGPVIFFRKKFGVTDNEDDSMVEGGYQYAAVKCGPNKWVITGGKAMGAPIMTWREILAFVFMRETKETSPAIWIATGWDALA